MKKLFNPKRILVTGGAGFIGSNYIRYTLKKNPTVSIINLDALTYAGNLNNLPGIKETNHYHFIKGDICDETLVNQILLEFDIDTIVNFAAESHVDRSILGPATFVQTNIVGTYVLLNAARNYWLDTKNLSPQQHRFHHISTDEVYGSLKSTDPAFKETTIYQPNSPYSASKASADHLVRAYHHTYGLATTVSNCSNNYGPYQHREKLIPTIIQACFQQQTIPLYGDGSNIRDWLYVEDHCRAIEYILHHGKVGETYNIGGGNEWSNLKIAELICSLLDKLKPEKYSYKQLIQFVTDRRGHDWRYAIDMQKIKTELNWQPQESFNSGIKKTIDFYLNLEKSNQGD